jgi:pyridoxal/pyridoxine/pyridoxamine kinase
MAYMDYKMYQAIMAENNLVESQAVKLFLKRAAAFNKRKKTFMKQELSDRNNGVLLEYIHKTELQRQKAVWDAIDCAEIEKRQGFYFIEQSGGDKFMAVMITQYEGDLSRMTALEKATYKYFELIDEMRKRANRGQLAN